MRRGDSRAADNESPRVCVRGTETLKPPPPVIQPYPDRVQGEGLLPEQVRVAVAVEVLRPEGSVATGRSPEWQGYPLVRAAQIEFQVAVEVSRSEQHRVSQAIPIEI